MTWTDGPVTVHVGEARRVLASLEPESAQTVITSPPYWGLRDYGLEGEVWGGRPEHRHRFELGAPTSETNYSDKRRWQHTRNGRDEIQPPEKRPGWKRERVEHGTFCRCGAWHGSLGLEPTPELYVDHLVEVLDLVRRVLRRDGTLWLNLGDSYASGGRDSYAANYPGRKHTGRMSGMEVKGRRPDTPAGLKAKDLVGIPWRTAFALQARGWYLRADIIWSKPNPMPESCHDRPTKAHEYVFLLSRSERYRYDAEAIREPDVTGGAANGEALRQKLKRPDGWASHAGGHGSFHRDGREAGERGVPIRSGRNKRSVWEVPTQPYPEAHFATFPEALVEPCVLAGAREGDVVLDPFAGSGTTLAVARRLGRRAVGIELQASYLPLIQRRAQGAALPLIEMLAPDGDQMVPAW